MDNPTCLVCSKKIDEKKRFYSMDYHTLVKKKVYYYPGIPKVVAAWHLRCNQKLRNFGKIDFGTRKGEIKIEVEPEKEAIPLAVMYRKNGKIFLKKMHDTNDYEMYGFLANYCRILDNKIHSSFDGDDDA